MAFVHILQCADDSYYVGSTHSLEKRLWQHNEGLGSAYTRRPARRPVTLVWSFEYANVAEAFAIEKQVQGWSRAKREALIRGDYEALPALAKKNFGPPTVVEQRGPPRHIGSSSSGERQRAAYRDAVSRLRASRYALA